MAEDDTPYSPFEPPEDYDTSKVFDSHQFDADFKIERTSRPSILPRNIKLLPPQQYMRCGIDVDSLLRETTEITMDLPSQLVF